MLNKEELEKLEIMILNLFENHMLNHEDFQMISKYLIKVKNDLKL